MVLEQYIAIAPILGMDLHLIKFSKGYTWFRLWDDLKELDGKVINQQIKLVVPQQKVNKRPSKFYVCVLVKAESEENAYEKGIRKIEEFVFLSNVYLRRSFRILLREAVTLPMPKTQSIADISLIVESERIKKITSPLEGWTLEVPYFGEITHKDIYPAYFELTDIRAKVSETASVLGKKTWLAFETKYRELITAKTDQKELLVVIGPLYALANSAETVSLSYIMLWEILEAYSGTDKDRESLLSDKTLGTIRELMKEQKYTKEATQIVLNTLRGLKKETLTQQMAKIVKNQLFPERNLFSWLEAQFNLKMNLTRGGDNCRVIFEAFKP
jgi:hypothetical protein